MKHLAVITICIMGALTNYAMGGPADSLILGCFIGGMCNTIL